MSTRLLRCSTNSCYDMGQSNHNKELSVSDYVKPKVAKKR